MVIFISCTKVDEKPCCNYIFSVKGSLEEMPIDEETKVSLSHTMRMTWAVGDAVSVVNMTTGMALGGSLTADKAATTSTFSGVISGSIENGDVLALIYPSLGYMQPQPFADAIVDFSSSDGTDKNAKFCAVATITADADGGNFVGADTQFYMKSGIINITFADLPASTIIKEVSIPNLYSTAKLSINSAKTDMALSGINGIITMIPNSATGSQGTKGLYMGLGGAAKASSRRTVSVVCGEDVYESTMTDAAIGAKFYTLSVGAFEKKSSTSGINIIFDDSEMEEGDSYSINAEE